MTTKSPAFEFSFELRKAACVITVNQGLHHVQRRFTRSASPSKYDDFASCEIERVNGK